MKILHIWNTTGSGSTISKFMDRIYKTKSWVITRKKFDPWGHTTYGETSELGAKLFTLKAMLKAMNYDLLHIHAFDKIIPYIRIACPNKKIIMHYRGEDIRGVWNLRRKYWSKADVILVSTLDLLEGAPKEAIHIPRAVDTDFFYKRHIENFGTAFHVTYRADDLATKYAKENNLALTIHDRLKHPILNSTFGEVLSNYEYYIDVKRNVKGKVLKALSKTGLESLACGLKVIRWDGKVSKGLSERNLPENVVKNIFQIYSEVLNH